jgi:hypothetical protein
MRLPVPEEAQVAGTRTVRIIHEQPAAGLRRQLRQPLQLGAGQRDACAERAGARSALGIHTRYQQVRPFQPGLL